MTPTTTPAAELQAGIRAVQAQLAELEQLAYSVPHGSSVRPTISQARACFNQAGFGVYVERLTNQDA